MKKTEIKGSNELDAKETEYSVSQRTAFLVDIRKKVDDLGDKIAEYLCGEYDERTAENLYNDKYCPLINSLLDVVDNLIFESVIDNLSSKVVKSI